MRSRVVGVKWRYTWSDGGDPVVCAVNNQNGCTGYKIVITTERNVDGGSRIIQNIRCSQGDRGWRHSRSAGAAQVNLANRQGVGEVKENRIVISELMDTRGGRFGADFDPDDVKQLQERAADHNGRLHDGVAIG